MSKSVKILITLIISILVIFTSFWIISKPIRADQTRKQDILNFLNGKSFNNISKETQKIYKEMTKTKEEESFNISDLILDYTIKIKKSLIYKKQRPLEVHVDIDSKVKNTSNESVVKSYLSSDCSIYLDRFSEDDLKLAGSEKFNKDLIDKLEEIFTHKSSMNATEWYIDTECLSNAKKVDDKTYEFKLPYETYIIYNEKQVELKGTIFTDCSIKKIAYNNYELTLKDNKNKEYKTYMRFNSTDWFHKRDMTIDIYYITALFTPTRISLYTDNFADQEEVVGTEEYAGLVFEKIEN